MKKITVELRCLDPDCKEKWTSSATQVREEWGPEIYIDDENCPICKTQGEVIDENIDRDTLADMQYDSMIEEKYKGVTINAN